MSAAALVEEKVLDLGILECVIPTNLGFLRKIIRTEGRSFLESTVAPAASKADSLKKDEEWRGGDAPSLEQQEAWRNTAKALFVYGEEFADEKTLAKASALFGSLLGLAESAGRHEECFSDAMLLFGAKRKRASLCGLQAPNDYLEMARELEQLIRRADAADLPNYSYAARYNAAVAYIEHAKFSGDHTQFGVAGQHLIECLRPHVKTTKEQVEVALAGCRCLFLGINDTSRGNAQRTQVLSQIADVAGEAATDCEDLGLSEDDVASIHLLASIGRLSTLSRSSTREEIEGMHDAACKTIAVSTDLTRFDALVLRSNVRIIAAMAPTMRVVEDEKVLSGPYGVMESAPSPTRLSWLVSALHDAEAVRCSVMSSSPVSASDRQLMEAQLAGMRACGFYALECGDAQGLRKHADMLEGSVVGLLATTGDEKGAAKRRALAQDARRAADQIERRGKSANLLSFIGGELLRAASKGAEEQAVAPTQHIESPFAKLGYHKASERTEVDNEQEKDISCYSKDAYNEEAGVDSDPAAVETGVELGGSFTEAVADARARMVDRATEADIVEVSRLLMTAKAGLEKSSREDFVVAIREMLDSKLLDIFEVETGRKLTLTLKGGQAYLQGGGTTRTLGEVDFHVDQREVPSFAKRRSRSNTETNTPQ